MPSLSAARASTRIAGRIGGAIGRSAMLELRAAAAAAQARSPLSRVEFRGAEVTDFDPLRPDVLADPYPWYARLHEGGRVHVNQRRGLWILHRHDDVRAALGAHETFSSAEGVALLRNSLPTMMLLVDRPEHTRLRAPTTRHFTHEAVAQLAPRIGRLVEPAVNDLQAAPGADAVAALAVPVPIAVISDMLGVPAADRQRFRSWSERLVEIFNLEPFGPGFWRKALAVNAAGLRLHAYLHKALEERKRAPGEDLLTKLLEAAKAAQITEEEVFWIALLLLVAGNETTTNLIASLMLALAEHPEQYALLRRDQVLIPGAIEEALRYYAPIQATYRTTRREYAVGDVEIPANTRVLLLLGAASRDPRQHRDPDRFDIERGTGQHLSFGSGIHFCLGAHLARLEATTVLQTITERATGLSLVGSPEWRSNATVRGLARLPVALAR